jgi:SAM-dependent methyltransferase
MPEGEAKIIDSNIPDKEGGKMRPSTWDSLSKVGYSPEASEKTQIATTAPTYESIVKANATQGMEVLDFSAGRGIGTKAMKAIGKKVGFNVEGYEPFSNEKTRVVAPEYEGEDAINQIPDNSKDIIINNAVLNVVPEDTGRQIVNQIYSKLKPGGSAFINVMGWNNIKNRLDNPKTQLVGPREVVTQKGTFQKGYTAQSLRSLIEQELPDAKIVRTSHGDIGFKVTKPAPQIMAERELEKSKPKAKGNASAIANAAKLK